MYSWHRNEFGQSSRRRTHHNEHHYDYSTVTGHTSFRRVPPPQLKLDLLLLFLTWLEHRPQQNIQPTLSFEVGSKKVQQIPVYHSGILSTEEPPKTFLDNRVIAVLSPVCALGEAHD